jgi:methyl-accepting chemotaxis protein
MNQMDTVTQMNAAMVEQSKAAIAALTIESAQLRALIRQFSLTATENPERLAA